MCTALGWPGSSEHRTSQLATRDLQKLPGDSSLLARCWSEMSYSGGRKHDDHIASEKSSSQNPHVREILRRHGQRGGHVRAQECETSHGGDSRRRGRVTTHHCCIKKFGCVHPAFLEIAKWRTKMTTFNEYCRADWEATCRSLYSVDSWPRKIACTHSGISKWCFGAKNLPVWFSWGSWGAGDQLGFPSEPDAITSVLIGERLRELRPREERTEWPQKQSLEPCGHTPECRPSAEGRRGRQGILP